MNRLILAGSLLLGACTTERRLEGQVVDVWGNPIEGATVVMEGQSERPLTDRYGRFSLPLAAGDHKMKAGREGYIQEHMELEVPEGAADTPKPVFKLFPKPVEAGFYVIGAEEYERLEPKPIVQVGGELQAFRGLATVGETEMEGSRIRLLFHTPLKMDQVMRLGLELHKLEFVHQAEMTGPLAKTRVDVNLWTSAGTVPIDIKPLRSRNDYLVETQEPVEPGAYAFDTQGMLTTRSADTFKEIPEPLRVAYPVELR